MKLIVTTHCGLATCAESPGNFCQFIRSKSFGQQMHCILYGTELHDDQGWVQRCSECLKDFPASNEE